MTIDDSFKKPGSVPFKWEIRPGVPKLQDPRPLADHRHSEFGSEKQQQKQSPMSSPFPETPRKLKPPPAGLYFQPTMEPRTPTRSVRELPRALSHRSSLPGIARSDIVSSAGCFPSPVGKLKRVKKSIAYPRSESKPDYYSDLEVSSRWSVSSRKSASTLSSSFASYQSSPRPVKDSDWAAFGLF